MPNMVKARRLHRVRVTVGHLGILLTADTQTPLAHHHFYYILKTKVDQAKCKR